MDETASKVREERQALGWSQELLAKKTGVDVRTIRRLEAGERVAARTVADVRAALKGGRPGVEVKADAVVVELKAVAPTVTVDNPPAEPAKETAMVQTESSTGGPPVTPEMETFGDWLEAAKTDPELAERTVRALTREIPRPSETKEKLSMGYEVVNFLERFPDAQVYVLWDAEPGDIRNALANFLASATGVLNDLRHGGMTPSRRFEAQCYFADHLAVLGKEGWTVTGIVTTETNFDGLTLRSGAVVIDLTMSF